MYFRLYKILKRIYAEQDIKNLQKNIDEIPKWSENGY